MPIFQCSKCGCIENTAVSHYWLINPDKKDTAVCSECDPEIGKWHGKFLKESAKGMILYSDGFLYNPKEIETDQFRHRQKQQDLKVIKKI